VSKGVGYVSFAINEDAQSAFDTIRMKGSQLDSRKLRVQWADIKVCITLDGIGLRSDFRKFQPKRR